MKITKYGIFIGQHYSISWGSGGSTSNGNGNKNIHFFISWKVGNGDNGDRCL